MDKNRNGIPDFVEGMIGAAVQTQATTTTFGSDHPDHSFFDTSKDKPKIVRPAIEPESSGGWMLALAGIAWLSRPLAFGISFCAKNECLIRR